MKLRTVVRDSLYLTWALPTGSLPELPRPLRYQSHLWQGCPYSFASLVLSRQEGVRLPALPFLRLSHPQLNLFVHVFDLAREPAVYLHQVLAPGWMAPGMRILTGLPVSGAAFEVPGPVDPACQAGWRWRVRGEGELVVTARLGPPRLGEGPQFSSWERLVQTLRERTATYALGPSGLRRLGLAASAGPAVPLAAEVEEGELLEALLPLVGGERWPPLYAAWLDSEVSVILQLGEEREPALPSRVPAPG